MLGFVLVEYLKSRFSVGGHSASYAEGWDRVFGHPIMPERRDAAAGGGDAEVEKVEAQEAEEGAGGVVLPVRPVEDERDGLAEVPGAAVP